MNEPKTISELMTLGMEECKKGNYNSAIIYLNKAIEIYPNDARFNIARARLKADQGNHEDAIEDYTKAIEIDPNNPYSYCFRGVAKIYKESIFNPFGSNIKTQSDWDDAFKNYKNSSDYQDAIEDVSKAIELDPKNAEAFIQRGLVLVLNYKLPRGCVDLKTGKNLEPKGLTASWYNDLADKGLQLSFCRKIYD